MAKATGNDPSRTPVDMAVLRQATSGDRDLMEELAELYLNDADLQLRALDDALENKEYDRIRRIGHSLKGSSSSIGAGTAAEAFKSLEEAGRAQDETAIRAAIARGTAEFERVKKALAELR
jgi:HPt (histidine-containing phosphotransfer) domain-containing protein